MPPSQSEFEVPAVNGGYSVIDGRTTHRCLACGAYVEYRDKTRHTQFHKSLAELRAAVRRLETPQDHLFEPPF